MNKIAVIIVSYNFERWMERCLGSLRRSSLQAEVIVVDNASQDRTVPLLRSRYPEVHLIESRTNLGFGRANNLGIARAMQQGCRAVFLLNQDAWVGERTLETLLQLSDCYPQYGILSPVHLNGRGDRVEAGFAAYTGLDKEAIPQVDGEATLRPISFVNAAFWLIPLAVLKQVGGFCPLFYHYGEDVDYINRVRFHGYTVGYSPAVSGCHDREERTVTREAFLRSEQVYLLSEYANIRRSFVQAFAYGVLAGVKKAWKALWAGRMADAAAFLRMTCRLVGRTGEVIHYRRQNRLQAPSYIHSQS